MKDFTVFVICSPNAAMVLMKVIVMLRFMSPLNRSVQKLDEDPPGEHPSVNKPKRKLLSSKNSQPIR